MIHVNEATEKRDAPYELNCAGYFMAQKYWMLHWPIAFAKIMQFYDRPQSFILCRRMLLNDVATLLLIAVSTRALQMYDCVHVYDAYVPIFHSFIIT